MIKAILFDLDGLVIITKKRFSQRLSEEKNIPMEAISEFFDKDFRICSFGKADLKEKITPYINKWGYQGTVDDLLKFWFEGDGAIDEEVLKIVDDLRTKNLKCYIATRQEKYRKEYLLKEAGLENHFDGIFCTCDIGFDKSQQEYWNYVFEKLNSKPEEIMFFCDSQKNIDCAKELGIQAYFYTGKNLLREKTNNIG